jgi:hypothetical protein
MSSAPIFDGTSARQRCAVVNIRKCKKTAKIVAKDTTFIIFCAAAIEVNDLQADTVLYGTSAALGFHEGYVIP